MDYDLRNEWLETQLLTLTMSDDHYLSVCGTAQDIRPVAKYCFHHMTSVYDTTLFLACESEPSVPIHISIGLTLINQRILPAVTVNPKSDEEA